MSGWYRKLVCCDLDGGVVVLRKRDHRLVAATDQDEHARRRRWLGRLLLFLGLGWSGSGRIEGVEVGKIVVLHHRDRLACGLITEGETAVEGVRDGLGAYIRR